GPFRIVRRLHSGVAYEIEDENHVKDTVNVEQLVRAPNLSLSGYMADGDIEELFLPEDRMSRAGYRWDQAIDPENAATTASEIRRSREAEGKTPAPTSSRSVFGASSSAGVTAESSSSDARQLSSSSSSSSSSQPMWSSSSSSMLAGS